MIQTTSTPDAADSPWLHRFSLVTALATLALVVIGGLVTSHGAGMAVPDWPNTYGYNMFLFPFSSWVGGILYEHSHRLMATCVGLLTSILAVWLWTRETSGKQRWLGVSTILFVFVLMGARVLPVYVALACLSPVAIGFACVKITKTSGGLRWLGIIAFAAVILQGVLGGLRVVWLKDEIGIVHAALAQLFFCLMCVIALVTSKWWRESTTASHKQPRFKPEWLLSVTTLLLLIQLILGATMRHQHAGLAIPDFPLAYGKIWPAMDGASVSLYNQHRLELIALNPITGVQVGLQMAHRFIALVICLAIAFCAWSTRKQLGAKHCLTRLTSSWIALIVVQALLGAATIWSNKAADIATAHVLMGAICLALGVITVIVSFRGVRLARNFTVQAVLESPAFSNRSSAGVAFN